MNILYSFIYSSPFISWKTDTSTEKKRGRCKTDPKSADVNIIQGDVIALGRFQQITFTVLLSHSPTKYQLLDFKPSSVSSLSRLVLCKIHLNNHGSYTWYWNVRSMVLLLLNEDWTLLNLPSIQKKFANFPLASQLSVYQRWDYFPL